MFVGLVTNIRYDRAGAPTAHGQWVSPRAEGESDCPIATTECRGHFALPPTGEWTFCWATGILDSLTTGGQ